MKQVLFSMMLLVIFSCAVNSEDYELIYHEKFEKGPGNWQPLFPDNWQIIDVDGEKAYELTKIGDSAKIRKPKSMSILTPYEVGSFELQVMAKCYTDPGTKNRDICLFYGYQDDVHFYYTHFAGASDNVHNAIHIVDNADRLKINNEAAGESKALLKEIQWYKLTVKRDVDSGTIEAFVDDELVLTATDTTFKFGKIGIGSFDDTGAFKDVKLWGELIGTKVGQQNVHPTDFWLGHNYPNPFNPSTFIDYHLPKENYVSLSIYDVTGREMSSIVDGVQEAGTYSVTVAPQNWPSGIYYYKLSTPLFSDVKKMTLLN